MHILIVYIQITLLYCLLGQTDAFKTQGRKTLPLPGLEPVWRLATEAYNLPVYLPTELLAETEYLDGACV